MRILVGLGNPGEKYEKTRHNAGFWVVDAIAEHLGVSSWKKQGDALIATVSLGGENHILAKPQTFMNESGRAVAALLRFYQIIPEDLLIVADDVYIKPGEARVRKSGGDAGHNGWRSIHTHIPDGGYQRLRVGVGLYPQRLEERASAPELDAYVLSAMPKTDHKRVDALVDQIMPDLVWWLESGTALPEGSITAS